MRYNAYIVTTVERAKELPPFDKYVYKEMKPTSVALEVEPEYDTITPTWYEAINRNSKVYTPREIEGKDGIEYIIWKDQYSMLNGEISAIKAISNKAKGEFLILNHDEALAWIAENEIKEELI